MDATPRLNLPYIAPQQAQKQVTYNEAMKALDRLVQPVVLSRSIATPPGSPAEGCTAANRSSMPNSSLAQRHMILFRRKTTPVRRWGLATLTLPRGARRAA